jgi:F-type H+-transporting ATPase subunit delta
MKISAKQYALVLYESIEGKKKQELDKILDNFVHEIMNAGMSSKINLILEKFHEIWSEKNNEIEAKIFSARELDKEEKKLIINTIKEKTGAGEIDLDLKIDPLLIGGLKIEYSGKVLDLSFRERIKQLKSELNKE